MAWKRFPVPAFDHGSLRNMSYTPPERISGEEAARIAEAAAAGDASVAGGYAVEPDQALLDSLDFRGDHREMILCALPGPGAQLVARSWAWFNGTSPLYLPQVWIWPALSFCASILSLS